MPFPYFPSTDELSRRAFVANISKTLLGVGVAPLVGSHAVAATPEIMPVSGHAAQARSVIFLYLNGGMSHVDSFDPKPGQDKIMGATKAIPTNVDGVQFGHYLPLLSQCMDKMTVIRSMNTTQGAHEQAQYINRASYAKRGTIKHPGLASWVSLLGGRRNPSLPASVAINGGSRTVANGFLPASHAPLPIQNPVAGLKYSEMPSTIEEDDYHKRLSISRRMNDAFLAKYRHSTFTAYKDLYDEALKLMSSRDLEAFDVAREPEAVRAAYGSHSFGQGCLLARRLVQRHVRFVEVEMGGWDTHNNHFQRFEEQARIFDRGLSTLLNDLDTSGLLEETLVVVATDFGRTPVINGIREGRDHHPRAFSTMLAGGGVKGGEVYGKTDETASTVIENKVSVQDFNATIAHAMGIPVDKVIHSPNGRPFTVADKGRPITSLFA